MPSSNTDKMQAIASKPNERIFRLRAWSSERFFPGGPMWIFPRIAKGFYPGVAKSFEILFLPLESKNNLFAKKCKRKISNFKI